MFEFLTEICGVGLFFLIGFLIFVFAIGIRIVRPREKGLIERLGKYKKTADQGFHWIIPVIDRIMYVNPYLPHCKI